MYSIPFVGHTQHRKVYKCIGKKVCCIVHQISSYLLGREVTIKVSEEGKHLGLIHLLQCVIQECLCVLIKV